MGEEWRKGWHLKPYLPAPARIRFLIVGAGPTGLECARLLGRRGYSVHVAEAGEQLGGRVTRESRLPGLAAWARVRDYRVNQLNKMQNVEILRGSRVMPNEVLEFGATRVVLATGARWRRDGIGRANARPIPGFDLTRGVLTPDDLLDGMSAAGPVIVFDDDHYYLGGVLAEKLRSEGHEVTLITPADRVSAWTVNTLEQHAIQKQILELGIEVLVNRNVVEFDGTRIVLECTFTGRQTTVSAASVVTLTLACRTKNSRNHWAPCLRRPTQQVSSRSRRSATVGRRARSPRPSMPDIGTRANSIIRQGMRSRFNANWPAQAIRNRPIRKIFVF